MNSEQIAARFKVLERHVHNLSKELKELKELQTLRPKSKEKEVSLQGFVQYQSIEVFHPCLEKHKILDDKGDDNPNNIMCFTPTTYTMYAGTSFRPPLLAIREVKTYPDAEMVEVLGTFEKRHRVDLVVEFHSVEVESYFTGILKNGSTKENPTEYRTSVHVPDPSEFVDFLSERYNKTISLWNVLR